MACMTVLILLWWLLWSRIPSDVLWRSGCVAVVLRHRSLCLQGRWILLSGGSRSDQGIVEFLGDFWWEHGRGIR